MGKEEQTATQIYRATGEISLFIFEDETIVLRLSFLFFDLGTKMTLATRR